MNPDQLDITDETTLSIERRVTESQAESEQATQSIARQGFMAPDGKFLADADLVGTVFANKYEILELIGKGGMSVVYRARHNAMSKIYAVKVLHLHLADDEVSLKRFRQEAQASSNLSHPGIVCVHDYGEGENQMPYLVMDFIEGISLSELLKKTGPLSLERFLSIMQQVASALVHAHASGIVHRDLKPSNIMITNNDGKEQARIVDFGIAKVLSQSSENGQQQLTQTGEVFGSPLYMSPEQCSGTVIDQRTDIYALGCVMYEAISGTLPHRGSTVIETMHRHVNEPPPPLVAPQIPDDDRRKLEVMLLKCLAKLPEDRYQSVADLESELRQLKIRSGTGILNKLAGAWDLASAKRRAGRKTKLPLLVGSLLACMLSVIVLLVGLYQAQLDLKELARVRSIMDKISATQAAFLTLGESTRTYFASILFHRTDIEITRKRYMKSASAIIQKLEVVDKCLELDGFGSKENREIWRRSLQKIPNSANESITKLNATLENNEPMWSSENIEVVNYLSAVSEEGARVLTDITRQARKLESRAARKFESTERTVTIYSVLCVVINGVVMISLIIYFVRGNPEMRKLVEQAGKLSRKHGGDGIDDELDDVAELDNVLQELATALSEAEDREKALISKLREQERELSPSEIDTHQASSMSTSTDSLQKKEELKARK